MLSNMTKTAKIKQFIANLDGTLRRNRTTLLFIVAFSVLTSWLLVHRLSTLTHGALSAEEWAIATTPIGRHGIAADPYFLISKLQHSAEVYWFGRATTALTRLPSVMLGGLSIISLSIVLRFWHGGRIAVLGCLLFAFNAWTLHISRYGGYESSYLIVLPLLLLTFIVLERAKQRWVPPVVLLTWGILLYTPGIVWFILLAVVWQRQELAAAWTRANRWWQRVVMLVSGLVWLPLLVRHFIKHPETLTRWLGLPSHYGNLTEFGHRLAAVPVHLFIHGPGIPELWLGRLPILDVFTLIATLLGGVYYFRHRASMRAKLLVILAIMSVVLIALGGDTSLSLIVPLLFIFAAAGVNLLLRDWLSKFPANPVARFAGVALITLVVLASCTYNWQQYFIAWPHNTQNEASYRYRP